MRPFGVSCMLAGFSPTGEAQVRVCSGKMRCSGLVLNSSLRLIAPLLFFICLQLYQTDPAGTYSEWKANAVGGKSSKNMREFLEKNCTETLDEATAIKLCVKALLEVVDSGAKNMEICLVRICRNNVCALACADLLCV